MLYETFWLYIWMYVHKNSFMLDRVVVIYVSCIFVMGCVLTFVLSHL